MSFEELSEELVEARRVLASWLIVETQAELLVGSQSSHSCSERKRRALLESKLNRYEQLEQNLSMKQHIQLTGQKQPYQQDDDISPDFDQRFARMKLRAEQRGRKLECEPKLTVEKNHFLDEFSDRKSESSDSEYSSYVNSEDSDSDNASESESVSLQKPSEEDHSADDIDVEPESHHISDLPTNKQSVRNLTEIGIQCETPISNIEDITDRKSTVKRAFLVWMDQVTLQKETLQSLESEIQHLKLRRLLKYWQGYSRRVTLMNIRVRNWFESRNLSKHMLMWKEQTRKDKMERQSQIERKQRKDKIHRALSKFKERQRNREKSEEKSQIRKKGILSVEQCGEIHIQSHPKTTIIETTTTMNHMSKSVQKKKKSNDAKQQPLSENPSSMIRKNDERKTKSKRPITKIEAGMLIAMDHRAEQRRKKREQRALERLNRKKERLKEKEMAEQREREMQLKMEEEQRQREISEKNKRMRLNREKKRLRKESEELSYLHYQRHLIIQRGWNPWMILIEEKKRQDLRANDFHQSALQTKLFVFWRSHILRKTLYSHCIQECSEQCAWMMSECLKKRHRKAKMMISWFNYVQSRNEIRLQTQMKIELYRMNNLFRIWMQKLRELQIEEQRNQQRQMDKSVRFHNSVLQRKIINDWMLSVRLSKQERLKSKTWSKVESWLSQIRNSGESSMIDRD